MSKVLYVLVSITLRASVSGGCSVGLLSVAVLSLPSVTGVLGFSQANRDSGNVHAKTKSKKRLKFI